MAFVSSPVAVTMCAAPGSKGSGTSASASPTTKSQAAAAVAGVVLAGFLSSAPAILPSMAAPRFPPIDRSNLNRCSPASSNIGQANAARDSLLDLRECNLTKLPFESGDFSGALLADADLSGADLRGVQMSKSYAANANFSNADMSNGIFDRVEFAGANLKNAILVNSVLSTSSFENADVENTDWTDAYLGDFEQKNLCRNPTLKGSNPVTGAPTRESLGCR